VGGRRARRAHVQDLRPDPPAVAAAEDPHLRHAVRSHGPHRAYRRPHREVRQGGYQARHRRAQPTMAGRGSAP
jgi:hypothetical protein